MKMTETASDHQRPFLKSVNGEVTMYDESGAPAGQFRVPPGMSFMAVVGSPDLQNGDEFRDDWWRYRNGVRFRKWLHQEAGFKYIWPPDLDHPARIFRLMLRLKDRLDRVWKDMTRESLALLPEGEKTVAVVVPRRSDGSPMRVEIEREMFSTGKMGYSIGSEEDGTEKQVDSFTRAFWYRDSAAGRFGSVSTVLWHALERRVRREVAADDKKMDIPILLRLLGFDFWMQTKRGRWGELEVVTITWPGAETFVVDLDAEEPASS